MSQSVPERFRHTQQAVESQIREAFRGVTREGGISWTESIIVDGDGSHRTPEQARAEDTERCWEELVDDPSWRHEMGVGGFNFLDPIGFRYYIAPAMIRCIREGGGEFISYALTVDDDFKRELISLINAEQAHAVAGFVRLMIATHVARGDHIDGEFWVAAYRNYWRSKDRGSPLK